ncbi:MAG: CapA family protein [Bacteroidales bacterium]|jgi:poly-gamma-glutamate synthesis protein (capsule biosynthesis protein)|nr:CapA family protein [Bacteroidales bacterium]
MRSPVKIFIVLIIFACSILAFTKITADQTHDYTCGEDDSTMTLLFIGDIMQHQSQIDAAWNDTLQAYIYDSCFKYVTPLIRSYDYAIANFEFTLGGKPYTGYPQFSAPDAIVNALLFAGIDIVGTANNHSCDRGKKGIERTIKILDSLGLRHTGTFLDSASRVQNYPMIISKNGIKIALLNYTYGTNSLAVPKPNIVNLIEENQIKQDLQAARDSMPDKIIVFIHWGDEYKSYPNEYQEYYAKLLFDHGTDIIIGMHPHVIQRIERKFYPDSNGREVFIVYSLGNYISNQRDRYRDGGMMVSLNLARKNKKVCIDNAGYYLTWVYTPVENNKKRFYVLPAANYENIRGIMDTLSCQKMKLFLSDSRELMKRESIGANEK